MEAVAELSAEHSGKLQMGSTCGEGAGGGWAGVGGLVVVVCVCGGGAEAGGAHSRKQVGCCERRVAGPGGVTGRLCGG